MAGHEIVRRLRGALGNALVWGAGWFVAGLALFATLRLVGVLPASVTWTEVLEYAVRAGIVGVAAGGAFSLVIGLLYRGRRLSEISWVRFGIAGGVVTGIFVPLFLQAMNLLSGDGLVPWELVLDDGVWTAAFGGVAAGGTLKLAQLGESEHPGGGRDRLEAPGGAERLASSGEGEPR